MPTSREATQTAGLLLVALAALIGLGLALGLLVLGVVLVVLANV